MLFFSLATAGAVLVSVIAAAISVTRRRTGLRNVKDTPALAEQTEKSLEARGSFWIRLVPFSAVLGVIVGLLVVFTSLPWFLGKGKLLQADSRYTCKARGGLDPFSQLGDLNGFQHQIYTASKLAQHLFNTGLLLEWNFNQAEALRAFKLASEADPTAAMPYWGITYALGPGANRDVTEDRQPYPSFCPADFELAESAAKTALQLASKAAATDPTSLASQQDLAFAEAASQRFAAGSALGPARTAAEEEYAKALLDIGRTFNNTKALAIAAESYMNLSPWDYYAQPDVLRPSATKAEALLTEVLQEDLDNPLALHLHIHISEASTPSRSVSTAGRGEPSADRLTGQGPWSHSQGHLMHMASHTFVRLGRYHDGIQSNVRAFAADIEDVKQCREPYLPEHNLEMLIYSATLGGEVGQALRYAKAIRGQPDDSSLGMAGLGGWTPLLLVQSVYGLWDGILQSPGPPADARGPCPAQGYKYAVAVFHYTRTLAHTASCGAIPDSLACSRAVEELHQLRVAEGKLEREAATLPGHWPGIYGCEYKNLSTIYLHTATARLAVLQGNLTLAESELRKAAAIEDRMAYQEPARLLQPVRHALGYVLLSANKGAEAEQVYRENLAEHPANGFGLLGLSQSLAAQGELEESQHILDAEFKQAWKFSDVPIHSSSPSFADVV
ncbi:TPA: hypothetical protein ACH3X2_007704 [Trebouxia sp. C0005]